MFKKLFDWVGGRARLLVIALALIVAGNVLLQAYTHKTTPLLAWKGGGFGMYTEPHAEDRSVWIRLNGAQGIASVRFWPETPEFAAWQAKGGLRGTAFLNGVLSASDRFRYYPRKKSADEIIGLATRVVWPDEMVGDVRPIEGKVFKRNDVTIVVYENRYDLKSQEVVRISVFEQKGGEQLQ
ncbi:MAG: hypothetical protein KC451_01765 [Amylibacter sp.]|jgi:hypothetical protein|nr:hypothetical protein [Amylibacter sp.]